MCAGYAAEIAAGYPEDRAEWRYVSDLDKAGRVLEVEKIEALELMRQPENRRAVARVAQELLLRKHLAGEEVSIIIDVTDGRTTEEEYRKYLALRAQQEDGAGEW